MLTKLALGFVVGLLGLFVMVLLVRFEAEFETDELELDEESEELDDEEEDDDEDEEDEI